jgi:hypothetical protein
MHAAGVHFQTLAAMAHGIEVSGALLDNRPFKAKGLGRTRFLLALSQLFPPEYLAADRHVDLYGQLRSHLSHSLLPGQLLTFSEALPHLSLDGRTVNLSMSRLFSDYEAAMLQLLKRAEEGRLKEKMLLFQ